MSHMPFLRRSILSKHKETLGQRNLEKYHMNEANQIPRMMVTEIPGTVTHEQKEQLIHNEEV